MSELLIQVRSSWSVELGDVREQRAGKSNGSLSRRWKGRCSKCGAAGHNARTCGLTKEERDKRRKVGRGAVTGT